MNNSKEEESNKKNAVCLKARIVDGLWMILAYMVLVSITPIGWLWCIPLYYLFGDTVASIYMILQTLLFFYVMAKGIGTMDEDPYNRERNMEIYPGEKYE